MNIAIVAITAGGAALARKLGGALPGAEVHLPERFRQQDACRYHEEGAVELLPRLFAEGTALVCIMASGIVVRVLAPHLRGKGVDPAVVVADEKGRFAISLLSGHLGGANELARRVAQVCGGEAVITTATDVNDLPAWDEVARIEGLFVEPQENIRFLNRLLLEGKRVVLKDRLGRVARHFAAVTTVECVKTFAEAIRTGAEGRVYVTSRFIPDLQQHANLLLLRPRSLLLGIGCNRGTTALEIEEAVAAELRRVFLSPRSLAAVATIDQKADEEGIREFARTRQLPVLFFSAAELNAVSTPSEDSPHALAAVGARGVCEPAALLASGGGRLLTRKVKIGNVTLAVAEKAEPTKN